ncbi:MAG: hypothetical protein PHW11_01200 [Anaerolineaceae bacterium]|nr:hypothetical protein [Anaerolineaceae bacterium]MDD4043168.1 hypothetical protein [Anaerolineaceae bacterium]MDD4578736.1 hypothetical protein [Anaerolineaceae bacterium]
MNIGPFFSTDAIGLTLAADQHFFETPSTLDAVWQLETEQCAPISLLSTLGLQARSFQIMPQVSLNKVAQEKIQDFFCRPSIDWVFSNYIRLSISPVQEVKAIIEFWVRSGDWVQGRISITNHSETNLEAGARLAARLIALQGNSELKPTRQGFQTNLKGQTGILAVILGMEGSSKTVMSPNLALEQSKHLTPGETLQTLWQCQIQKNNGEQQQGSRSFPTNWDGEIARLQVANQARMVHIVTPQTNWDAAFYSSQNQAYQLLRKDGQGVVSPDRSRSIHSAFTQGTPGARGGISAIELWQLIGSLLPAQVELAARLLKDYLLKAKVDHDRNPLAALPFPCLCDLTWRVHQAYQQKEYLLEIYPTVKALCLAWFMPGHDRNQNGIPEWSSIEQCGLTSLPAFDLLDENDTATRISFTEQLNLSSLLAIELAELRKIALVAEDQDTAAEIDSRLLVLIEFITSFAEKGIQSSCLDRENHHWHGGEVLYQGDLQAFGTKSIYLAKPARLNLRLKPALQLKKPPVFHIHGENAQGDQVVEAVEPANLLWLPGSFFYTTSQIYARIDKLSNLQLEDCFLQIHQADLLSHDLGLLFTAPVQNDQNGWNLRSVLAANNYGVPENLDPQAEKKVVNLGWNLMLLANLIRNDEVGAAFELLGQLQQAQINHQKLEHSNTDRWSSQNGRFLGLRNTIGGLIPVSLVLELAGIRIFNENKVSLRGQNPFPWVFRVQYRGLEVTRDGKNATVRFPDGSIDHHFGSSQKTLTHEAEAPAPE